MASSATDCQAGETFFLCQQPGSSTDDFDYCGNNLYCPVNEVWAHIGPCCFCGGCLVSKGARCGVFEAPLERDRPKSRS